MIKKTNSKNKSLKGRFHKRDNGGVTKPPLPKDRGVLFKHSDNHWLKWLCKSFGYDTDITDSGIRYILFIEHLMKTKGHLYGIKVSKEIRLRVTRWLGGSIIEPSSLRLTYDGLPVRLGALIPLIRSMEPSYLRIVLTFLSWTRRVPPKVLAPNISTIISPYSGQEFNFDSHTDRFLRRLKYLNPKGFLRCGYANVKDFSGYHLSTKTGPTGKQALISSILDITNIPDSLQSSICRLGGPVLERWMRLCRSNSDLICDIFNWPKSCDVKSHSIRKITAIPDSEGKTRVVAIGDYWSQTCLLPLHQWMYSMLEKIPQDKTYKQGDDLRRLPSDGSVTFFCFDLSSATDRFPIKIIYGLVERLIGKFRAKAWYDIMVGQPFDYKNSKVSYSVGNPMGFYSSWAGFTLSHHLIMFICCERASVKWSSSEYMLLGDDIIIWNDKLAAEYRKLIDVIGVEISDVKTHISSRFFEFAKRFFFKGNEISPQSSKFPSTIGRSISATIDYIRILRDRGWIPIQNSLACALSWFTILHRVKRRKFRDSTLIKVNQAWHIYNLLKGFGNDLDTINSVLVTFRLPQALSCNHHYLANNIMRTALVECFAKSAENFAGDLQDRAINFVLHVTGSELDPELIQANPGTFVIGKFVEEPYIRDIRRAYDIDTYGREWTPRFRVLTGVNCEQLITGRNFALISSVSPILVKHIKETLYPLVIDGIYGW